MEGAGLEQERRRLLLGLLVSCRPAMHKPEQSDQPDQPDQPPCTERREDSQTDADTGRRRRTEGRSTWTGGRWTRLRLIWRTSAGGSTRG